jgi:THO complex subunit 2
VLRELIWKMTGIEPLPSLSESQITAMAGGPALRIEAVASTTRGARMDPTDPSAKAPQRLGKALMDTSLAFPLLVQIAQQRQACVFRAPDTPLKILASLFDAVRYFGRYVFSCLSYRESRLTAYYTNSSIYSHRLPLFPPRNTLSASYLHCVTLANYMVLPCRSACRSCALCLTRHCLFVYSVLT